LWFHLSSCHALSGKIKSHASRKKVVSDFFLLYYTPQSADVQFRYSLSNVTREVENEGKVVDVIVFVVVVVVQ